MYDMRIKQLQNELPISIQQWGSNPADIRSKVKSAVKTISTVSRSSHCKNYTSA